jgi:Fungalysin metallopeptidase (M36)/PA domain/Secretion system C-terminal sorting domain/Fungalysin/Thermolysin Propeptide Motif
MKYISLLLLTCFQLLSNAQSNLQVVQNYFAQKDMYKQIDYLISSTSIDKQSGITHLYLQQTLHQIPIYNAITICAIKNIKVVYCKNGFIENANKTIISIPKISPEKAVEIMLQNANSLYAKTSFLKTKEDKKNNAYSFVNKNISAREIEVKLVYQKIKKQLVLAWHVSADLKENEHWWNYRIDATTGAVVDKNDYTNTCDFSPNDMCAPPPPPPNPVASYRVFNLPKEAPSFGARMLLTNPEDTLASPFGWHDTNGVSGAEYTITKGNNVYAYEDTAAANIYNGYSPTGISNLQFDYSLNLLTQPITNIDAGITNLFYMNNKMHDYLYPLGFDEDAGNFQYNNYGNGGVNDDQVYAEGFDGGGQNNANFSTPPDGYNPKMQMYQWSGNSNPCTSLSINAPGYVTGSITFGNGAFSSNITVVDTVKLVNDGVVPTADGCTAIVNNIAGKIALIDRGNCNFIIKAQAAQNAGAVGLLLVNNVAGGPNTLGGSGIGITIPVLSISQADGQLIKNALAANVTVIASISTCTAIALDANLDNGVIAHEYGHGLSNRLTGGAAQSGCLSNAEQGGEGWSDWLALMTTIEPGDVANDARGVGTYLTSQPNTGSGIRRYPYSYDMAVNPQVYGDVAGNTEVHAIGEIWCAALWDLSWLLMNNYGYNSDANNTTAGNNIAMRLVIEGMKLQPCEPGFIDARDAILLADNLLYNDAHRCEIWQAFARRGMGVNADQGDANVAGDETQDFTMPTNFTPVISTFPANATVCAGGAIQLAGIGVGPFTWSGGVLNATNFYPTNNGVYTVTSTGVCAGTNTTSIVINALPIITTSVMPNGIICSGNPVSINANINGSTLQSLNWSNGVINNTAFTANASAVYTVTITNTNNCTNTATASIIVTQNNTSASIAITANSLLTSVGQSITYKASILPSTITGYQLQWYLNGALFSTSNSPLDSVIKVSGGTADSVYCVLTIVDACFAPSIVKSNTITVRNITSIGNIALQNGMAVYPNPAKEYLQIDFKNNIEVCNEYKIVDELGKVVLQNNAVIFNKNKENKIEINALPSGTYYLILMNKNAELGVLAFVKQ